MVTVVTKELGSVGRDYSTLASSESDTDNDLVTADEQIDLVMYDDSGSDWDLSTADARHMTVNGDTSDATRYRRWVAADGFGWSNEDSGIRIRFNGIVSGTYSMIQCQDAFVRFERLFLVIATANDHAFVQSCLLFTGSGDNYTVQSCHARVDSGTSNTNRGYRDNGADGGTFIGCVAARSLVNNKGTARGFDFGAGVTNCAMLHCACSNIRRTASFGTGVQASTVSGSPGLKIRNTIAVDCALKDFDLHANVDCDYSYSSDDTADDGASGTNSLISQSDPWVSRVEGDYHLVASSTAIGAGEDQRPTYTLTPVFWDGLDAGGIGHRAPTPEMGVYRFDFGRGGGLESWEQRRAGAEVWDAPGPIVAEQRRAGVESQGSISFVQAWEQRRAGVEVWHG